MMERMDVSWKNSVNLYGLIAKPDWRSNYYAHVMANLTLNDYTHDDLDRVLTELGYKRFKSKKKPEKIHMLLKCSPKYKPDSA